MQQYNIQRIYIFWAKHLVHSEIVQDIVTSFKAIKDPTPFQRSYCNTETSLIKNWKKFNNKPSIQGACGIDTQIDANFLT